MKYNKKTPKLLYNWQFYDNTSQVQVENVMRCNYDKKVNYIYELIIHDILNNINNNNHYSQITIFKITKIKNISTHIFNTFISYLTHLLQT